MVPLQTLLEIPNRSDARTPKPKSIVSVPNLTVIYTVCLVLRVKPKLEMPIPNLLSTMTASFIGSRTVWSSARNSVAQFVYPTAPTISGNTTGLIIIRWVGNAGPIAVYKHVTIHPSGNGISSIDFNLTWNVQIWDWFISLAPTVSTMFGYEKEWVESPELFGYDTVPCPSEQRTDLIQVLLSIVQTANGITPGSIVESRNHKQLCPRGDDEKVDSTDTARPHSAMQMWQVLLVSVRPERVSDRRHWILWCCCVIRQIKNTTISTGDSMVHLCCMFYPGIQDGTALNDGIRQAATVDNVSHQKYRS